jgi:hypothetical protein
MPQMFQIRTQFSGFTGAPGYSQMYFDASGSTLGAQSAADAVAAFWNAIVPHTPASWHFTIQSDVSKLDDSTGDLVSVESITPLTQVGSGGDSGYAGGVGAVVGWITNAVHGTRRLKGRTFVVPLSAPRYEADGTITSAALTTIRAAATTLIAHADFGVWGRPVGGVNGLFSNAAATNTRDHVAILRSRRD